MRGLAPEWLAGCALRDCCSSPPSTSTSASCATASRSSPEGPAYTHAAFRPWRVQALAFKALRRLYPGYDLWRDFPYEYELGKLPIDVINGGPDLREWGRRPRQRTRRPRRSDRPRRSRLGAGATGVSPLLALRPLFPLPGGSDSATPPRAAGEVAGRVATLTEGVRRAEGGLRPSFPHTPVFHVNRYFPIITVPARLRAPDRTGALAQKFSQIPRCQRPKPRLSRPKVTIGWFAVKPRSQFRSPGEGGTQ